MLGNTSCIDDITALQRKYLDSIIRWRTIEEQKIAKWKESMNKLNQDFLSSRLSFDWKTVDFRTMVPEAYADVPKTSVVKVQYEEYAKLLMQVNEVYRVENESSAELLREWNELTARNS